MGSGIHKTTVKNIYDILNLLREAGEIHIRGISRSLNLNPFIISNIVEKYLSYFIEKREINQFGIRVTLIKFKPGREKTTVEEVLKYAKLKKKINGT
jgi:hypothetical protein